MNTFSKLIYPNLSYKVNGILFAVRNKLGRFYNEQQYSDAIEKDLKDSGIKYEREKILPPSFKNEQRGRNKIDFLIADKIILEVKVKKILTREDYYQIKRYLIAMNKKLGIIVNFRKKYIEPKRILNSLAKE